MSYEAIFVVCVRGQALEAHKSKVRMQFCDNFFYDDQVFYFLTVCCRFHCQAGTLFITSNDDTTIKNDYTPEHYQLAYFSFDNRALSLSGIKLLITILKRENIARENQRCGTECNR